MTVARPKFLRKSLTRNKQITRNAYTQSGKEHVAFMLYFHFPFPKQNHNVCIFKKNLDSIISLRESLVTNF